MLLDAQFIAAIQVLVYAGAVMVLFLFVIMLLNLGHATLGHPRASVCGRGGRDRGPAGRRAARRSGATRRGGWRARSRQAPAVADPATAFAGRASWRSRRPRRRASSAPSPQPLFQAYLVPFEITSILLLAAIVGAVVLAKRKI